MIRPGFLDIELRQNLIELARDGLAAHRLARRANALVLLDDGMSCEAIAKVLLLDDDTIRTWYRLYEEDGIEGLTNFSYEGSACQLSGEQQEKLKAWLTPARLLDRELLLARRPAADRSRRMGRMHGVRKQHGLVVAQGIQQLFVALNESPLLFFVELARDDIGFVIFEPQAMQQRDQS